MKRERTLSDDVYSTVKSFAAKGTLLPPQTLLSLSEARDLDDLVTRLRATIYSEEVSKLRPPYSAMTLELAFRAHLARVHDSLVDLTPDSELLRSYYFKYIVHNLKTVLKGRALGRGYEELTRYLDLYAEELVGRRDLVIRALSAPNLEEIVNLLRGEEMGREVERALASYRQSPRVEVFDLYLDRAFYTSVSHAFGRLRRAYSEGTRGIVSVDIDSFNVLSILRAKLWNLDPSEMRGLIIKPTFDVPERVLIEMVGIEVVREAARLLSRTPYRTFPLAAESEEELVGGLEDSFTLLGFQRAIKPFLWDVEGLSVSLGAVRLKEAEVRNLSAIAFGVEQKTGSQAIMQKLIMIREGRGG